MSQAQALLDCTADLVEHCGVLAAVDVLQVILPIYSCVHLKFRSSCLFRKTRICISMLVFLLELLDLCLGVHGPQQQGVRCVPGNGS